MKKVLFFLALIVLPLAGNAQVAKFKSVFTLSFIRHIGWTESAKQGDFVIGVVRDKEIADWMSKLSAGKKFGFQNVVIKEFKSPEEVVDCQVVYVSSNVNFSKHAATIVSKVNGGSTLIITEAEGACNSGSMINFVVRDDKLKFEIHKGNAAKFGLQISSKLEGMSNAISL
ncbi:YfiR family protein [Carboxylicivirga sediminis]|uniref:YfiR family protein n=1 Tax=Carboxylicivirga sediminis TaxID=2006564 RepID=A0A941IZZ6_9BACT|nr:YfiR family protein [Carboxylicivirga sediminis]MBR8537042.1 YfiR family protein [Carboxylicivirga sediminis]